MGEGLKRAFAARATQKDNPGQLNKHVQRYLAGCNNEEALEYWLLAVGRALQRGQSFDRFLGVAAQLYVRKFGVPVAPAEHGENSGTDAP